MSLEKMDTYSADVFEGFGVTEEEVAHFKNNHSGFCRLDMNRVSKFLLIQLTSINKHRTYNSSSITDAIQELEGVGRGCKQRIGQFKHLPLKGLFKVHYHDAKFIGENLINHWGLESEGNPKLSSLYYRVAEEEGKTPSKFGWQGRLAHEMTVGGYEERAMKNKLTGEWIIFAKHNNQNYYLCISRHAKSKSEDREIYDFIKLFCKHEYPFLLSGDAV